MTPAGSWTQYGDVEAICCDCGYSEVWGAPTRRPPRFCPICRSRAVRLERHAPGKDKPIVIYDGAAKKVTGVPVPGGMTKFVWCLMGHDAGQPLDEIIIRKEAERMAGGQRSRARYGSTSMT